MRLAIAATAVLALAAPALAESDLSTVEPVDGTWTYAATPQGSEATFVGAGNRAQLTIRCARATRQVTISKPASTASPLLWVWSSSQVKNLPATFDPQAANVSAVLPAFDPMLDAIVSSRGRFGVSTTGTAHALVVPPWADVARVVEDCRV